MATWLDYAVFAPIGLATVVVEDLPKVVDVGRQRVTNRILVARIIGKYAVRSAGAYVTRRLDELAAERDAELAAVAGVHLADSGTDEDFEPDAGGSSDATVVPDAVQPAATDEPAVLLSAMDDSTVTATMSTAAEPPTIGELAAPALVDAEDLALADYDSLAASQIVARLPALVPDELEAILAYESTHRQRRTVIGKVHQLQSPA